MSSLLDNLASPDYRPPRGPECGMALVLAAVDDKTRKTLLVALDNPYAPAPRSPRRSPNSGTAPASTSFSAIGAANVGATGEPRGPRSRIPRRPGSARLTPERLGALGRLRPFR